jgi:hypothetical protein
MRKQIHFAGLVVAGLLAAGSIGASKAAAQDPIITPLIVDTAVPIIINAVKPKPTGLAKFQGYVMNANNIQVTVRAKNSETAVQTFALTGQASTKMQELIDKGGFQYGDKITVYYNPQSLQAVKFKGKPSKPL